MRSVHFPRALAFAVALTSLAAAGAARADVTSPAYDPSKLCRAEWYDQVGRWQTNTGEKSIKNNSAIKSKLYCPIRKVTSAPGVYNDYIQKVELPFTFAQPGQVDCVVRTWRTGVNGSQEDNVLRPAFASMLNQTTATTNDQKKTMTITGGPSTTAGFWDGTSPSFGKPSWYYSMVTCDVPPGAKLWPYKVTEAGADRGYTIDPMITCPLTSDMHWRMSENPSGVPGPTGYVMAQAFGGLSKFYFSCPVPNKNFVQVSLGRAGVQVSGCSMDTTNIVTPQWPATNGTEWPTDVLPLPYHRSIYVPSTGTHTLHCGQTSSSGDSKWMSYRTIPNNSKTTHWTASASSNNTEAYTDRAIDNDGSSRWNTNGRGLKNAWYQVDFGSNIPVISNLILDSGTSTNDWARKFTVMFSNDGNSWIELNQYTGTGSVTSVTFSEQAHRFIRIRLDQDMPGTSYWSIHELQLLRNNGN